MVEFISSTFQIVIITYFCRMNDFRPGGFQQIPVIVKNLLIINVLVFLLTQVLQMQGTINLEDTLALYYWQSPKFRWWQLFTHLFMHGGVMHIAFNMFSLWMFGRILENFWGPQRFILFYLVCGLGAALCHLGVLTWEYTRFTNAFMQYQLHPTFVDFAHFVRHYIPGASPGSMANWDAARSIEEIQNYYTVNMLQEPTVGASGAVCGLLFAFGYLWPNTELYIYFIPIPIKAKWIVTGFILIELSEGLYHSAGDNIAHFAHLGGMLFAFILLRIWNKRIRNRFY